MSYGQYRSAQLDWLSSLPLRRACGSCLPSRCSSKNIPAFRKQHHPSILSSLWWLQLQHFLNMLFMMFIIRAGIQILADHPRLYWDRDCTPGTEWFRFQHPVPEGRIWTAKDDSVTLPSWLGIPGLRHTIGLARRRHFSIDLLWILNGAAFYVLLFTTNQWQRLIPITWDVFPNAISTAIQYASLNFPVDHITASVP
jgi:methionine sulfoxide reductase catalytic subunit